MIDTITITKEGKKILFELNKIKGKRVSFRDKKIAFLFEPIEEYEENSLSMFRITYFDHENKKWVELNKIFNLQEKRKIIEGFFLAYHKIVQETCTSINKKESYKKTKDGLDKVNVKANCTARITILQTNFKKGVTFPPYIEDLDSLF